MIYFIDNTIICYFFNNKSAPSSVQTKLTFVFLFLSRRSPRILGPCKFAGTQNSKFRYILVYIYPCSCKGIPLHRPDVGIPYIGKVSLITVYFGVYLSVFLDSEMCCKGTVWKMFCR